MQMHDLTKPISECTDEELLERLRVMRSNRTTIRPAAKDHEKREAKKGGQTRIKKAKDLIKGMDKDQLILMLQQLEAEK